MQGKIFKSILFFLIMAAYLLVPFYMIASYDSVLKEGTVYRFRPRPVDPYDAFRGKYITLYFIQNSIGYDTTNYFFKRGETVYLKVEKDSAGYGMFTEAYKEPPKDVDYIKTTVQYESHGYISGGLFSSGRTINGEISFDLPFNRYYLPEEMAAKAEKAYFNNLRQRGEISDSVYVDIRIKDGKALIEELYFQGVPVKEFIHRHEAELGE